MEGNQMKMRDALEAFVESVEWLCEGDESGRLKQQFGALLSAARAALSAPARNCDVGTEEEQIARYGEFCQHECSSCDRRIYCHIRGEAYRMKCMMKWAQLPYEQEGDV